LETNGGGGNAAQAGRSLIDAWRFSARVAHKNLAARQEIS
jgi:hypothetical protein